MARIIVSMARTPLRLLDGLRSGPRALSILLAGMFLAATITGCADERSAGASTETTNGFSGQALDSDGAPAVGARVRIWDPQGDLLLGQATSGPDGRWRVPGIDAHLVGIEVTTADNLEGVWRGGHMIQKDTTNLLVVRTGAFSSLRMVNQNFSRLAGTPWRTTDGLFRSLPPGSFTVLADTSSRSFPVGSVRVAPATSDSMVAVRDSGLLMDDFDDGDSTWTYGPVRGNVVRWFTQVSPGATLRKPLYAESTATPGMVDTGAYRGRSLRIQYWVPDTGSYAQTGIYFRGPLDLSVLRSIRIKAKGNGILRMGLNGYGASGTRVQWQLALDSTWKEYVLRPGSEMAPGPSDPPRTNFQDIAPAAYTFIIQAYRGSEFWVDDIRFDGITPEMVIP